MADVIDRTSTTACSGVTSAHLGDPVLVARDLKKAYKGNSLIIDGVNLCIRHGERVALIGSNGSGKSTLLKCLIALHPITGGKIKVMGETFTGSQSARAMSRVRRKTGFVFQNHCLVRRRSVLSNVIHGMLGQPGSWRAFSQSIAPKAWREAAMAALDEVNLAEYAEYRADALSGGQQQRVAIARALVRQPQILIADEPAASLDPVSGRDVMALFARLCRDRGITLLYTTHDMDHAREFSDRTLALRNGRIFIDRPSVDITARDLQETFDG
ncbi:MAG: ATP-binding cassette domain-containing protein [Pseudomonadota bacterium]